ncbi:MAG: hypothetical protein ACMV0J_07810 [Fluviibacter sp.]|jgi:hypothetical protein
MKYKIEIRIPTTFEWVAVETGAMALQQIKKQVALIKRIYPEYIVRALDTLTLRTLVVA